MCRSQISVGLKVRYKGDSVVPPCVGYVTYISRPVEGENVEGYAIVQLNKKPEHWPYLDLDFAPRIEDLEKV